MNFEKLKIENRITLLEGRSGKDNMSIIKKLKRKLRQIDNKK